MIYRSFLFSALATVAVALGSDWGPFASYQELSSQQKKGTDFEIDSTERLNVTIFAIHGGKTEQGTAELAQMIAGEEHSLYLFKGITTSESPNRFLMDPLHHITSHRFDEPKALDMASRSRIAVSIHGYEGVEAQLCLGGKNEVLRQAMFHALKTNFPEISSCELCCPPHLGQHPKNIVNRPREHGVQIEMGIETRGQILSDPAFRNRLAATMKSVL